MKQLLVTIMLAASLVVAGCAPENPDEAVARYTDEVKQVIAAFDAIRDEDSAMAAAHAYVSILKSAETLGAQAAAKEPVEREVLFVKYSRAVQTGDARIRQHAHKLKAYPAALKYAEDNLQQMTGAGP